MVRAVRDDAKVKAYFDHWHVYHVIIQQNYMAHRGIHDSLRESLLSTKTKPFTVLDLGCGDASRVAQTLETLPVSEYIGVDLSPVALAEAEKNLSGSRFKLTLIESEFGEYLNSSGRPSVDVVLAGFAVHHYANEEKPGFFADCIGNLKEGGSLYLYDVFCRPGETREQYLHSYCEVLEQTWTHLTPEERRISCEHARNSDFPVPYSVLKTFAESAGFICPTAPLFADEKGFHCLYHLALTAYATETDQQQPLRVG